MSTRMLTPLLALFIFVLHLHPATVSSILPAEHVPTPREIFAEKPLRSFQLLRGSDKSEGLAELNRRRLGAPWYPPPPDPIEAQVVASEFSIQDNLPFISEFYVKFQLGTPGQDLLLLLDTGSNTLWVQGADCTTCYDELLPKYQSNISSTFEPVLLPNGSIATWSTLYADGTENFGIVGRDTLTIDSGYGSKVVLPSYIFGVSIVNTGGNQVYSGILGMGPIIDTPYIPSFLSQLSLLDNGTYHSTKFRYCFPDRVLQPNATSIFSIGEISDEKLDELYASGVALRRDQTLWTPIILDSLISGIPTIAYAVNWTGIVVDGQRIDFKPNELTLEAVLNGTVTVLDSGTVITRLRKPYHDLVTSAYANATLELQPQFSDGVLYYELSEDLYNNVIFPAISFVFQKWVPQHYANKYEEFELIQPAENILVPVVLNGTRMYTFNMVESENYNLIGNFAQENFLIEYDLESFRIGFLRANCVFNYP